jgi:hypothetical protein
MRAGRIVSFLILTMAAVLLNALFAQAAGSLVLLNFDGILPAPGVSPDAVHAQVGLAQAFNLCFAVPAVLLAVNPRLAGKALIILALAQVCLFTSMSYVGIVASLPGASLLVIAGALCMGTGREAEEKTRGASHRTSRAPAIRWPRFDPNTPGDLDRAVKEVRRLQSKAETHAKEAA